MRRFEFVVALVFLLAFGSKNVDAQIGAASDEFEDASSLALWQRIHLVEGWNADHLEVLDVDTTQPGRLFMRPHSTSWYRDFRGPLVFKELSGDFVVTTNVTPRGRSSLLPNRDFSLGGIMVRTPRPIVDPATDWTPGGENYVFLSMGVATVSASQFQYEVKTTIDGDSQLQYEVAPASSSRLQIARIGPYVIALLQPEGGAWTVHRRYDRSDFPADLQVGLVAYTDWPTVSSLDPFFHNSTIVTGPGAVPDLDVGFDYFRVVAPALPVELQGEDLTDPIAVPDADLLAFLGANADVVATDAPAARSAAVLRSVAPSPFNPRTRIEFSLPSAGDVVVDVFDATGRHVRRLASRAFEAGTHDVIWEGRDDHGRSVGSGVYRVQLVVDGAPRDARAVTLVR